MQKSFPIEQVRSYFPALQASTDKKPLIFFDGPGGTQMAQQSVDAMVAYITNGMANLHGTFPTSIRTEQTIAEARQAMADLLNCEPSEVAFGQNMTSLAFSIARSLGAFIQEGDEVVVTEQDHRANVDPWITMAKDRGAVVKFIPINTETYTLDLNKLDELITEKTKLVAVGLSSNVTGTITEAEKIIARAKAVNAIVTVDAVHAVPHLSIDFQKLHCDILLCSAYKFFGPHLGMAVVSASLFEKLPVYKLAPAPQEIPDKLETGTQNHEAIAGLVGAIDFIQSLGVGSGRKERLRSSMQLIQDYEEELTTKVEDILSSFPEVTTYRAPAGVRKTPTFAFTIKGVNAREATAWFADNYNMCIADGHFYASTMADILEVNPMGGWIRIGLAPYNTAQEIELFGKALAEFVSLQK
ncbi:cysteine desulfurase-like protein [Pontibacter harenae]|uniref:cysteine desulfurase-like protein n=1 Tax=Pontibacter harenae TaxID=2894083 RepID=UPI001E458EDF|nr:cysteine desulfurase-like protein [Pontibacter harenae]MCC9166969.1 cysteine desulfurase-like protein [Pontibacter harenae]